MADPALLDLVNHAELEPRFAAYAGYDGLILHAQRRRANGEIVDVDLRGPGVLECDVADHGLRRIMVIDEAADPTPVYPRGFYVFAGFDVGKFELEYGGYSLIVNYALDGRRQVPVLNQHFLFDRRENALALLKTWEADMVSDKETFLEDEILRPHAIYRQVLSPKG